MKTGAWMDIVDVYDMPELFDVNDDKPAFFQDAVTVLAKCINTAGRVDLPWMEENSGLTGEELTTALKGILFQDPEQFDLYRSEEEGWLLRPQYICGNVKAKLEQAMHFNKKHGGRFKENIQALKQVMPERINFEDIGISIGSPWIPSSFYIVFAREVLGITCDVKYSARLHQWKITLPKHGNANEGAVSAYGTMRMPAVKILENTLNGSMIKIYDEVSRPNLKTQNARVLNKNETLVAQEKQESMQRAFRHWVGKVRYRMQLLEEAYYNTFACMVAGRYDGSFLTLPDLNPAFKPYLHQKNAVARILLERDVLLNHAVGTGKTNIMVMGIHERKRTGISAKNLVVVPNNVLEAFERAHRYLYPDDRILVIRPEREFRPANRAKTLETIRDEDFVAIYMAYSSFEMISMSRQYRLDQKAEEIRSLRAMANTATDHWERDRLRHLADRMSKELEKMFNTLPQDVYIPFDDLGITTLVVDEAHNFKNVSIRTRTEGVTGMHTAGSRKCNALLEKSRFVRRNGGSLLFATGTPLTNSISDLFVLQQYLQPEQLELLHLDSFDEWIGCFAARQAEFEVDLDSRNFRITTRFSRFHNLPELISLFSNVCDFQTDNCSTVGLPRCEGYIDTVVPRSAEQEEYIDELVYRTELVRAKLVDPSEDNPLKITNDGQAVALDIRMKVPDKKPNPRETKVYACTENVFYRWQKHPNTAQLIFCDRGTPKKGFNIYDALKAQLMEMGIPEQEIAFVHDAETDAKRRKLFAAVNKATVRVLIGSTSKLGTGVNVQERLVAIHHLDIPWKPSDLIQREGRLVRQGNCNEEVYIYRYITQGTFDAYSWQILENKQRFIGQLMRGRLLERDARDIDDVVLSYAEIKALSVGDPLLKTRIDTANRLERVKIHSRQREQELRRMQQVVDDLPGKLLELQQNMERLVRDKAHFEKNREHISRRERSAFGCELLETLSDNIARAHERFFDEVHGFRVMLPAGMKADRPLVILQGVTANRYDVDMRETKEAGCIQRIEHLLLNLEERITRVMERISFAKEECGRARKELRKGNEYALEASDLQEKLLDIDHELERRAEKSAFD